MARVTVICPTFKRHRYLPILIEQFKNQNYDKSLMDLIILDDSPDPYPFLKEDKSIQYIHDKQKSMLWEKRNKLNELSTGDIIVCMDDDDIYFPDRVSHAVSTLENSRSLLAGCSSLYIHDLLHNRLHFFKARVRNHLLNGTFAYKRVLLKTNKYTSTPKNYSEESTFTRKFTTPYVLLDCDKTIICVGHGQNTVPKDRFCTNNTEVKTLPPSLTYPKDILSTITDANPMIYWINMDTNKQRYKSMMTQLNGYKYHTRIAGLREPTIKYDTKKNTKQEANCLSSHLLALDTFVKSSSDHSFCVVCEDDIDFKDISLFGERIFYYVNTAPKNWEILQLFSIDPSTRYEKVGAYHMLSWKKWTKTNYSTLIYVIRKQTAESLLKRIQAETSFIKTQCVADLVLYQWYNTYTLQLPFFSEINSFESDIHPTHMPFHQKHGKLLDNKLKSLHMKYPFRSV